MPYYETIFETGAHSVAYYENDEEALSALENHQLRAISGTPGGPTNHPAERVKQVLVYPSHPADYGSTTSLPTKQVQDALKPLLAQDSVSVPEVQAVLWRETDSMKPEFNPHESQYKAQEERELDLSKLPKEI